jgi:hypothetical protein
LARGVAPLHVIGIDPTAIRSIFDPAVDAGTVAGAADSWEVGPGRSVAHQEAAMTAGGRSEWLAAGFDPLRADEAILIELTRTEPERVRPRSSQWTALAIALFTALTSAGLASQTIVPRLIDRAADRGEAAVSSVASAPARSAAAAPPAAVIVTRVEIVPDGQPRVHLAGTATVTLPSVEATVTIGGHTVGRALVSVDSDATIVDGSAPVGRALWLLDVPIPSSAGGESHDAVAVAEIRWPASSAGPSGSVTSLIAIADGRNAP